METNNMEMNTILNGARTMSEEELKGEKQLNMVLGIMIGIEILTFIISILSGSFRAASIVRLILTIFFWKSCHEGKNWARVTLMVLSILGGIGGCISLIALLTMGALNVANALVTISMIVLIIETVASIFTAFLLRGQGPIADYMYAVR